MITRYLTDGRTNIADGYWASCFSVAIVPVMATSLEDFDRFWAAYPRQQGLGAARRAWIWALSAAGNDAGTIIDAAMQYATYCRREGIDPQFIPMPAKWLADERWRDVLPKPPRINGDAELAAKARIINNGNGRMLCASLTRQQVREMARLGLITAERAAREMEWL